jgi:hypothetical protein
MLRYPSRACGTINNSGVESWSDLRILMSRGRTLRAPALDRRPQAPSTLTSASPDGRRTRLDPRKLGKLDNYSQEPWKLPLPAFIEQLYRKRFGKGHPDVLFSLEQRARQHEQEKNGQLLRSGSRRGRFVAQDHEAAFRQGY